MWNLGLHHNIICGVYIPLKTKRLLTCFRICVIIFWFYKWMSLGNSIGKHQGVKINWWFANVGMVVFHLLLVVLKFLWKIIIFLLMPTSLMKICNCVNVIPCQPETFYFFLSLVWNYALFDIEYRKLLTKYCFFSTSIWVSN